MPITLGTPVEYSNTSSFAAGDTITLSPATEGDYRVAFIVGLPNGTTPAAGTFSVDFPAGWEVIEYGNSGATSDQYFLGIYRKWVAGDADTLDLTFSGGDLCCVSACVTVTGASPTTFLDVPAVITVPLASQTVTSPAITTQHNGAVVVHAMVNDAVLATTGDIPAGDTLISVQSSSTPSNGWSLGASYVEAPTAGTIGQVNWGVSEENVGITFAIRPVLFTKIQAAYRIYADGSEAGSTPLQAQNIPAEVGVGTTFHIRVGVQSEGNSAPGTLTLQYKEVGDPEESWRDVQP